MENSGGEPAEGGDLEDVFIYMIRGRRDGGLALRRLCAEIAEARDFEDEIREAIIDKWDDENGPQD